MNIKFDELMSETGNVLHKGRVQLIERVIFFLNSRNVM